MRPPDPNPEADHKTAPAQSPGRPSAADPPNTEPNSPRLSRAALPATVAALLAGIVAGGLSWAIGESNVDRFASEAQANPTIEPTAIGKQAANVRRGQALDVSLTSAMQGALLGGLLGMAGAFRGGSIRSGGLGATGGLFLGGLIGGLAAFGLYTLYLNHIDPNARALLAALSTRSILWGLMGGTGGLAFGLGLGGGNPVIARTILGGTTGGLLAALGYEVGGVLLFPQAKITQPIADAGFARLIAHLAPGVFVALGAAKALTDIPQPASH